MGFSYEDWTEGTHQTSNDPTQWNGVNPTCKLCEKEAENMDEYCEDHQRCVICGDNDDCECEDEWEGVSSCCEARMDTDQKMCYECKDHCSSVWEEANENKRESRTPKDEAKLSKK